MSGKYDTPFKDSVAGEMPFAVVPTLGTDPAGRPTVATSATPSTDVTPKPLPINELFFGPGMSHKQANKQG